MAYLNKRQYEYRRESAAKRAEQNSDTAMAHGMTEDEAKLVNELCSIRHEVHSNIRCYISSNAEPCKRLLGIKGRINVTSLPHLTYGKYDDGDCINIDDLDYLYESCEVPDSDSDEYQDWYDGTYTRIYHDWEELNKIIEDYLNDIDKRYNTNFAPSGALRIM